MTQPRSADYLLRLVDGLCKLPAETEWVEFKENNDKPEELGEYISALSNSAAIANRQIAYMLWGIRDSDHAVVGTSAQPASRKVGNENIENWLARLLSPPASFRFHEVNFEGKRVVVLELDSANSSPVRFKDDAWIRIGSYKKRIRDHPDREKQLWRTLERATFEQGIAASSVRDDEVVSLIDYPAYFELLDLPLPETRSHILETLEADNLIRRSEDELWNVTNLGAVLYAKRLNDFPSTARKPLRVVQYKGDSRVETIREQVGVRGYAVGFDGMIDYITNLLPTNEVIGRAFRNDVPMYPPLAIRELVANALIHQDLAQTGNGPMVELFDDRLEITSPGTPLVAPDRFVDAPPKSRNEALASMMRRIRICEERGSGWDKIAFEIELHQLPAPLIELPDGNTRVNLFSPKPLREMDKGERIRSVYLHACLRYVTKKQMTNASLRERFGISPQNSAQASRLIGEAVEAGVVVPYDPQAAKKLMRYVPVWATAVESEDGV